MISFRPARHGLSSLFGGSARDVTAAAADRWVEALGNEAPVRPAIFLPGQLERIRGSMFGTIGEVVRDFRGGFTSRQPDTVGYRLHHVDLVDGVLYARGAARHLRPRARRAPAYRRPREAITGSLYETWVGNRWFGMWMVDDCLTYRLAERYGAPVTTARAGGHMARYEALLGFAPRRVADVHFDELILFDDAGHNLGKRARTDDLKRRLTGGRPVEEHPGVFILRGTTGERRILRNEREIAEKLAATRGFRVIDPVEKTADEIVADCAGAAVVMGVEGSHLVHGLMALKPGGLFFAIQPPTRAVSALKLTTDRQDQDYALVVGTGDEDGFTADWEEVERTLDLAH